MKYTIDLQLAPEDVYCPACEHPAWKNFSQALAFYEVVATTKHVVAPTKVPLICEQCGKAFIIDLQTEIEFYKVEGQ